MSRPICLSMLLVPLLVIPSMAQKDLKSCYRTTGVAIIQSDVQTQATIKAGLLGLVAGLGDKEVSKEYRKVFGDRYFKEDEDVTMQFRQLVIGGKSGTLIMYMLSTEGFFKAYGKEMKQVISSFRVE